MVLLLNFLHSWSIWFLNLAQRSLSYILPFKSKLKDQYTLHLFFCYLIFFLNYMEHFCNDHNKPPTTLTIITNINQQQPSSLITITDHHQSPLSSTLLIIITIGPPPSITIVTTNHHHYQSWLSTPPSPLLVSSIYASSNAS